MCNRKRAQQWLQPQKVGYRLWQAWHWGSRAQVTMYLWQELPEKMAAQRHSVYESILWPTRTSIELVCVATVVVLVLRLRRECARMLVKPR